ncbi:MAG: cyclic nucleotide-binding domain-containing protein [Actinomycetes bacterium]
MKKDAKIDRLSQVPMFSACSRKDLGTIARYADELSVEAGTPLVREGAAGREFYVLVEGKAAVTRGGREIATLGPGNYFGELSLLDGDKRDASVTATTPADLLVLGTREFATVLEDVPQITRKLLAGMARRLHELDNAN